MPLPTEDYYEDYPQIENGVGMLRSLSEEFEMALCDVSEYAAAITEKRRVATVTGYASYDTVKSMAERITSLTDKLQIDVYPIKNNFFGESVTVSGLLTGKDILEQLSGKLSCDELIIPAVALRREELDFLCGMKLSELSESLSVKIRLSENSGFDFVDAVFGIDCE